MSSVQRKQKCINNFLGPEIYYLFKIIMYGTPEMTNIINIEIYAF